MPSHEYTYETADGRVLVLEGDTQPSDQDVEQAAKQAGVSLALADTSPAAQTSPNPSPVTSPEPQPGMIDQMLSTGKDVLTGAAKGVGEGILGAGKMVQKVPGVTALTDTLYGVPGISENAMNEGSKLMESSNTAQSVGKVGERVGELFVPGMGEEQLGRAMSQGVFSRIPSAMGAGRKAMSMLYNSKIPRMAGDAISAGVRAGTSAGVHDENPIAAAGIAQLGPIAGRALSGMAGSLANPTMNKIASGVAGGLTAKTASNLGPGGMFGAFGVGAGLVHNFLANPNNISMLQKMAAEGSGAAAKLLSLLPGQLRPSQ